MSVALLVHTVISEQTLTYLNHRDSLPFPNGVLLSDRHCNEFNPLRSRVSSFCPWTILLSSSRLTHYIYFRLWRRRNAWPRRPARRKWYILFFDNYFHLKLRSTVERIRRKKSAQWKRKRGARVRVSAFKTADCTGWSNFCQQNLFDHMDHPVRIWVKVEQMYERTWGGIFDRQSAFERWQFYVVLLITFLMSWKRVENKGRLSTRDEIHTFILPKANLELLIWCQQTVFRDQMDHPVFLVGVLLLLLRGLP